MPEHVSSEFLAKATCPHCWADFEPVDVLAIASHEELRGDLRAGPDEMMRFLPSQFAVDGTPLDPRGMPAPEIACPHCHLKLPEASLSDESLVVSVIGSPACGKSFFLTALSWMARRTFPKQFALEFNDADPSANLVLSENERNMFLSDDSDQLKPLGGLIRKTQLDGGGLYTSITVGGHVVRYARPLLYSIRTLANHPNHGQKLDRLVAFYDNAGEHFQPGSDSPSAPVTRHLTRSAFQLFLFDPTMDARFRRTHSITGLPGNTGERQETVLLETATRYRRFNGLASGSRTETPLLVVLTKFDLWQNLVDAAVSKLPLKQMADGLLAIDHDTCTEQSALLRDVLMKSCPELVSAAEAYSTRVTYLPVSVLGARPQMVQIDGVERPAMRPRDIRPSGVVVPFLYGLRLAAPRLVLSVRRKSTTHSAQKPGLGK